MLNKEAYNDARSKRIASQAGGNGVLEAKSASPDAGRTRVPRCHLDLMQLRALWERSRETYQVIQRGQIALASSIELLRRLDRDA